MNLGAFSISLTVKDLKKSKAFYEELGFVPIAGSEQLSYLIVKNGGPVIGFFCGTFDRNMLTFNPGWDQNGRSIDSFTDVRDLQKTLKQKGFAFVMEADETSTGPGSFRILDPDGNPILVDQHR